MKKWLAGSILVAGLMLFSGCLPGAGNVQPGLAREITHELKLKDPVNPSAGPQTCTIIQTVDSRGFPQNCRMRLPADVCRENSSCTMPDVTVYWDALGRFLKIEPPPGKPLIKTTGDAFTPDDYARLDAILKDTGSLLGDLPLSTFASGKKYKDVDGVSGATAASIQNAVVKGASQTSWVLWHWVNGEVREQLLALTRKTSSAGFLAHCLKGGDPAFVQYALETLSASDTLPPADVTDAVLTALKTADRTNSRLALDYLKKTIPDAAVRNLRLAELTGTAEEAAGYQIIETLNSEPELDARTLETLASQMSRMSYLEVHRVLALIESRHFKSDSVTRSVSALAAGDNAFIARRAKEHLSRME